MERLEGAIYTPAEIKAFRDTKVLIGSQTLKGV